MCGMPNFLVYAMCIPYTSWKGLKNAIKNGYSTHMFKEIIIIQKFLDQYDSLKKKKNLRFSMHIMYSIFWQFLGYALTSTANVSKSENLQR